MKKLLNLEKEKESMQSTAVKGGSYTLILSAIVLGILIMINVFVSLLPETWTRLDISAVQLYSLTGDTKSVLNALDDDVTIYWIVQANEEDSVIENLLAKYESLSDHITVEQINPDTYPTFTEQYTDEDVANNSLVVECGDKNRYIAYSDIYLQDVDYSTYSYSYSFDGEGAITSAISYVVSEDLPQLYRLTGHGEADLPDDFASQLEKENIETVDFSLLNEDSIPEDADAVLIYAPTTDLSEEEAQILIDYVNDGGKIVAMVGPTSDGELTNFASVLSSYGVNTVDGVVVESDRNYYAFQSPYVLLPTMESSDITDPLIDSSYYAIVAVAEGLQVSDSATNVTTLLSTSDTAFSKADGYNLTTYDKEDGDTDGPFALAVEITTDNGGQMVWVSSSTFLDDSYNSYSSGANLDLSMNAISSLIGETQSVSIRSKSLSYNYLTISDSQATVLKGIMIGIIPMLFLALGIIEVVDRRSKRNG